MSHQLETIIGYKFKNLLFFRLSTKSFVLDTQEESSREIENIRRKISEQYQKLLERKK